MTLLPLLQSLTDDELRFIAGADYGEDKERHLQALRTLVSNHGRFPAGEYWYPYEVVELCAHALTPGHEREFTVCTLLVVEAVACEFDTATDLDQKLADRAQDYDLLPPHLREAVLDAYQKAGC